MADRSLMVTKLVSKRAALVPPRIGTPANLGRDSFGPLLQRVAKDLGIPALYSWQRLLSLVSLELVKRRGRTRLAYDTVGALVGRQSGKTQWAAARIALQCALPDYDLTKHLGFATVEPQHVGYLAQNRLSAVSKWLELVDIIEASPFAHTIADIRRANGEQMLTFTNGSWFRPVTPNRVGARGLSLDLAIIDEALAHRTALLSAVRPTMAQRDNSPDGIGAQMVILSSAGDADSELLEREMELGRAAVNDRNSRTCWMEWSAPDGCDHLDEAVWLATVPTLRERRGISIDFLRSEAASMPEDLFRREYLCQPSKAGRDQVIPADVWADCHRGDVILPPSGLILGLEVGPERSRAALVACGEVSGYYPVEVIEAREGLEWVLDRCVEVSKRWSAPVVLDVGGPASSLVAPLEALGVEVIAFTTRQMTESAASFFDGCTARRVCHLNDFRLNDAIAGASRRAVGDRWLFDRRRGGVDLTPLIAATMAMRAAETIGGLPQIH